MHIWRKYRPGRQFHHPRSNLPRPHRHLSQPFHRNPRCPRGQVGCSSYSPWADRATRNSGGSAAGGAACLAPTCGARITGPTLETRAGACHAHNAGYKGGCHNRWNLEHWTEHGSMVPLFGCKGWACAAIRVIDATPTANTRNLAFGRQSHQTGGRRPRVA
jgi:hypothetical protein